MSDRRSLTPMPEPVGRPLKPEEVPVDAFECALCGATLWMLGQGSVVHDCTTGATSPGTAP